MVKNKKLRVAPPRKPDRQKSGGQEDRRAGHYR